MGLFSTINYILKHPLNQKSRASAFWRFVAWQINVRLNQHPIIYSFTERSKLIIARGMTGATGNLYCGLHEFNDMSFLLHLLRQEDLFVDIGANIGSYTVLSAAHVHAQTISIEPVPKTFQCLLDNIRINNIQEYVKEYNVALGAKKGEINFTFNLDTVNHVATDMDKHLIKVKMAWVVSHPIQYFSPLLKEMAKEFDLSVYYLSDASIRGNVDKGFGQSVKWDIPLLDGYRSVFIKNYSWRKSMTNRFLDLINPGVIRSLLRDRSSIIIVNGWSYFSILIIIVWARMLGKKVWLRAENPLLQELKKSKRVIFAKRMILQYGLFKLIDRFLFIGSESKQFFMFYGVKEEDLIFTPYAVDNDFFQKRAQQLIPDKWEIKRRLALPQDSKIILFVGKYIGKKRPLDLLTAFQLLEKSDACLVMVGEGELRRQMEEFCHFHSLRSVILTGFVNQSRMAEYYACADVFVMCSGAGETWGLSVNEAMNFNLPVIVSNTSGCSRDLVQNSVNGFIVEEGNVGQLKQAMMTVLEGNLLPQRVNEYAKKKLSEYSISSIVSQLKSAVYGA